MLIILAAECDNITIAYSKTKLIKCTFSESKVVDKSNKKKTIIKRRNANITFTIKQSRR